MIHPGLWDSRTWDPQIQAFTEEHRVVRYDVRGYGRSSVPSPGRPYSHVRDLLTVMDAHEVERAALIGCSMGGAIAVDAALSAPERVTALVMVASAVGGVASTPEEDAWWEARDAPVEAALEAGDLETARRLQLEVWAPLGVRDEAGRRILEIALDNLQELTMDESGAEELDPPAAERLHEVSAPTLVLPADHDPPDLQRVSGVLAHGIPAARLVRIPDTDHVLNMRRPEAFNRIVLDWLREVG